MYKQQQPNLKPNRTTKMSIYMYTLRKTNSLTLEYTYKGVNFKFPVYRFKFAFANCSWDFDGNLKVTGSDKAKVTKAQKTFGDKPVLIDFYGDIYFQKTADPFWFDVDECPTGNLVGEIRTEDIETGETIEDEPFFLIDEDFNGHEEEKLVRTLIKQYYPDMKL
tara:strand:+ start:244 stop:735 length:492 start_codon:yes stop_codon:yes gene_type:complete